MTIMLMLALCGLALLAVFIYAACYVSGSMEDLERQAEIMARLMRVDQVDDTE